MLSKRKSITLNTVKNPYRILNTTKSQAKKAEDRGLLGTEFYEQLQRGKTIITLRSDHSIDAIVHPLHPHTAANGTAAIRPPPTPSPVTAMARPYLYRHRLGNKTEEDQSPEEANKRELLSLSTSSALTTPAVAIPFPAPGRLAIATHQSLEWSSDPAKYRISRTSVLDIACAVSKG